MKKVVILAHMGPYLSHPKGRIVPFSRSIVLFCILLFILVFLVSFCSVSCSAVLVNMLYAANALLCCMNLYIYGSL